MDAALTVLKASADPSRLRILALLHYGELAVSDLTRILRQSQPRVSRHLKILVDAGLVERHKEGAWVFFRLAEGDLAGILRKMLDVLVPADDPVLCGDIARLKDVQAERVSRANAYFAEHAAEWDQVRSLYISEREVEDAIIRHLLSRPIDSLLDIGTGTGRILEVLGPHVGRAVGIDTSQEMLKLARTRLEAAELRNVQVRMGDMYALNGVAVFDAVVIHQVLHYAEEPQAAIAEAARVLKPGGRLLVADFAPHDKEFLREEHAHRRLGFPDRQVVEWMETAGLKARVAEHLHGSELTVTLWLGEKDKEENGQ